MAKETPVNNVIEPTLAVDGTSEYFAITVKEQVKATEQKEEIDLTKVIDVKINTLNSEALRLNLKHEAFMVRVNKIKDNLSKITNAIVALEEAKTAVGMVETALEY